MMGKSDTIQNLHRDAHNNQTDPSITGLCRKYKWNKNWMTYLINGDDVTRKLGDFDTEEGRQGMKSNVKGCFL